MQICWTDLVCYKDPKRRIKTWNEWKRMLKHFEEMNFKKRDKIQYGTHSCKVTKECKSTLSDIRSFFHAALHEKITKVALRNLSKYIFSSETTANNSDEAWWPIITSSTHTQTPILWKIGKEINIWNTTWRILAITIERWAYDKIRWG